MATSDQFVELARALPEEFRQRALQWIRGIVYRPPSLTELDSGGTDDERLTAIETILRQIGVAQ